MGVEELDAVSIHSSFQEVFYKADLRNVGQLKEKWDKKRVFNLGEMT